MVSIEWEKYKHCQTKALHLHLDGGKEIGLEAEAEETKYIVKFTSLPVWDIIYFTTTVWDIIYFITTVWDIIIA
jgi:hypothetical protein